jgi:hypothetical protein
MRSHRLTSNLQSSCFCQPSAPPTPTFTYSLRQVSLCWPGWPGTLGLRNPPASVAGTSKGVPHHHGQLMVINIMCSGMLGINPRFGACQASTLPLSYYPSSQSISTSLIVLTSKPLGGPQPLNQEARECLFNRPRHTRIKQNYWHGDTGL